MLTDEELQFLNQFIVSRKLDGLNLIDAKNMLNILSKLNKKETNEEVKTE